MTILRKHIFTDWQGNVTMSTDCRGRIEQHVGYYPYGEPWREPAGQRLNLYGGKERQSGVLAGDYDFGPRSLSFTTLFNAPDRAAICYPHLSSYAYCAANPIRYIDPTGNKIVGLTDEDAKKLEKDFQKMFPDDKFATFRPLIKRSGNELQPISLESLSSVFNGIELNEDENFLVNLVVNTINSSDIHKVEYLYSSGKILGEGARVLSQGLYKNPDAYNEFDVSIIRSVWGEGATATTEYGSYSFVYQKQSPKGRRVQTVGHEVLGHGRASALGVEGRNQELNALRAENLVRRVMGNQFINHGGEFVTEKFFTDEVTSLPTY